MTSERTHPTDRSRDDGLSPEGDTGSGFDVEKARRGTRLLLEAMGQAPDETPLEETWTRRVPEVVETLSRGYRPGEKPTMRTFEADREDLVIKTGIPLYSLCEHHLLPYTGVAQVAYRPDGEIVGLSKLTRYVRWRTRRLTVQERLTADIADGLAAELGADVVMTRLSATHLCEAMRGIETPTRTSTTATVGAPTDTERKRFRNAVSQHDAAGPHKQYPNQGEHYRPQS